MVYGGYTKDNIVYYSFQNVSLHTKKILVRLIDGNTFNSTENFVSMCCAEIN